jgi:hypothetical protein
MNPSEKFGSEFVCFPLTLTKADGSRHPFHEICVCISPKEDEASTLNYAWAVFREVLQWAGHEFAHRPKEESYRIVVAWSRSVRKGQGHIFKVWLDHAGVCEAASIATPEECAARFGRGWLPFANWKKDVFEKFA